MRLIALTFILCGCVINTDLSALETNVSEVDLRVIHACIDSLKANKSLLINHETGVPIQGFKMATIFRTSIESSITATFGEYDLNAKKDKTLVSDEYGIVCKVSKNLTDILKLVSPEIINGKKRLIAFVKPDPVLEEQEYQELESMMIESRASVTVKRNIYRFIDGKWKLIGERKITGDRPRF